MATVNNQELHLYTYFRSTSSARIRTAASIKGLALVYHYISIPNGEHLSSDYEKLNPNHTVPTLVVKEGNGEIIHITQSMAILEFFEECYPGKTSLLPPADDLVGRAHVREMAHLIASDVQPPTNQRILKRVRGAGGNAEEWAKDIMAAGLLAFEKLAVSRAGQCSFGDTLTVADVILCPAIENAVRYGVDLDDLPTIKRVYMRLRDLEAFQKGDWKHQEDTPEELRPYER
ncbi:hypothetical protein RBB50_002469 [Rhinocladiella similis]